MASMEDHLLKLREERIAREKARIEKLRELNLKKYSRNDQLPKNNTSSIPIPIKSKCDITSQAPAKFKSDTGCTKSKISIQKSNLRRPSTVPSTKMSANKDTIATKSTTNNSTKTNKVSSHSNDMKNIVVSSVSHNRVIPAKVTNGDIHDFDPKNIITKASGHQLQSTSSVQIDFTQDECKHIENSVNNDEPLIEVIAKSHDHIKKNAVKISAPAKTIKSKSETGIKTFSKNNLTARKSTAIIPKDSNQSKVIDKKKSLHDDHKVNLNGPRESVFDRLSKPKVVTKKAVDKTLKPKTDDKILKNVIKDSHLITNKRRTLFEQKRSVTIRRSVSAVHFKRVPKSELNNCVHKWASIGEEIDKEHLENLNEDACIKDEQIISAIKSERKKVKFQTPLPSSNFNTPRPEEMRRKLQNWLQNRGKSLDSYHHLQCFGMNHLSRDIRPLHWDTPRYDDDDENKENIALEHDSDNDSYLENNNRNGNLDGQNNLTVSTQKWRRASNMTDTTDFNESYNTTLTSGEGMYYADELLMGALNDLTQLLREGFDWEQCARWLRALRERFPSAPNTAPYWECRAALEERRGDLHATVHCLEQAIAKGTEQSVVEANLDNLLDKFMQLKISPNGGRKQVDPKLLDIKNVFKSTIIRFAVQQAKLSQSVDTPKFTVTPVRRSNRLSRNHTQLRVYSTIHQTEELGAEFKPNKALSGSP